MQRVMDGRDALSCHLDRVRVPQLVRREPSPHARFARELSQLAADGGGWPGAAAGRAVDDAEPRSDG
jgi:hypothetical protein